MEIVYWLVLGLGMSRRDTTTMMVRECGQIFWYCVLLRLVFLALLFVTLEKSKTCYVLVTLKKSIT